MATALSVRQYAKQRNVGRRFVYEAIRDGKLRAINMSSGDGKPRWRITLDAIADFENARMSVGAQP